MFALSSPFTAPSLARRRISASGTESSARRRTTPALRVVASGSEPSPLNGKKIRALPLPIAQPQGYMWNEVKKMRPSTEEEATCQPAKDSCSIERIAMKYDERCGSCGGSGMVKTRSFGSSRNRRRSSTMGRCLLCGGVGFVRDVTTRIEPDFTKDDSMPANYDPWGIGFERGEEAPFCDVPEKRRGSGGRPSKGGAQNKVNPR